MHGIQENEPLLACRVFSCVPAALAQSAHHDEYLESFVQTGMGSLGTGSVVTDMSSSEALASRFLGEVRSIIDPILMKSWAESEASVRLGAMLLEEEQTISGKDGEEQGAGTGETSVSLEFEVEELAYAIVRFPLLFLANRLPGEPD